MGLPYHKQKSDLSVQKEGITGLMYVHHEPTIITVKRILSFTTKIKKLYRLKYESLYYLLVCYDLVSKENEMCSVYSIQKALLLGEMPVTTNNIRCGLHLMEKKGLIFSVSRNKHSNAITYYAPTQLAIDLIREYTA